MTEQPPKEFRIARNSRMLEYISQFSATEKVLFGALVLVALVTALIMAFSVNDHFLVKVPAYGGELREGLVGLPRTVNPVLAVTDADRDISALVYSGLMRYSGGDIVPDIARSYSVSPDGLTYTFELRNDIRFQDGTPLTADDVAFTIQKIQDPSLKSPRRADWANVTVKEDSPLQIEFALKQPYAPFLSNTTVGILPKHIWGSVGDDQFIFSQYNIQPVGTGPYKVGPISRDGGGIPTEYRVDSWNGYYGKTPYISTIAFDFFADQGKALDALDSGTIDSLPSVAPDDAARLASDSAQSYTIVSTPLPRVFGVFFNQSQAPVLADKTVRQALDMSVDRAAIVKEVLDGYGSPITGPLPFDVSDGTSTPSIASAPVIPAAAPASTSSPAQITPAIAAAQALLEKNGWKKDSDGIYEKKPAKGAAQILSFDIYTADTPDLKQAADMVKASWTALGADVGVKIFDPSDLYQNVIRTRKYDALLFGELVGKDQDVYAFWDSSQRNAPGLNVALYANSAVDKLLESIRSTSDEAARDAMYAKLDSLIRADIPAVFLYVPDFIYAIPRSLHGIDLGTVSVASDRFNSVSDWYVATQNVWRIFAH